MSYQPSSNRSIVLVLGFIALFLFGANFATYASRQLEKPRSIACFEHLASRNEHPSAIHIRREQPSFELAPRAERESLRTRAPRRSRHVIVLPGAE
jgi:hypothetical protein